MHFTNLDSQAFTGYIICYIYVHAVRCRCHSVNNDRIETCIQGIKNSRKTNREDGSMEAHIILKVAAENT